MDLAMMLLQFLNQLEVLLVNSLSDFLGFMFFERSQQRFLLINRNNIIGDSKEDLILLLDMVLQESEVGLCLIDKNFLSDFVFRFHEVNRSQHRPYVTFSILVFHQHHANGPSLPWNPVLFHRRKKHLLFFKMVALVGKMTEEIQRLLPAV